MPMRRPCESRLSTYEVRLCDKGEIVSHLQSLLWTRTDVPKYVVRQVPRDVVQSGHGRDLITTSAQKL